MVAEPRDVRCSKTTSYIIQDYTAANIEAMRQPYWTLPTETTSDLMQIRRRQIGDLLVLESTCFRRQNDSQHHHQLLQLWSRPVQIPRDPVEWAIAILPASTRPETTAIDPRGNTYCRPQTTSPTPWEQRVPMTPCSECVA